MEQKKIDRISQLSRLSRERELTEEEKQEQQLLRREYVDSMKNNLRATLQNVVIQHPDGSRTKLKNNHPPVGDCTGREKGRSGPHEKCRQV